jgi:hypothetical protein
MELTVNHLSHLNRDATITLLFEMSEFLCEPLGFH